MLRLFQDTPLSVDAVHILNIILGRLKEFLILLFQKHILIEISLLAYNSSKYLLTLLLARIFLVFFSSMYQLKKSPNKRKNRKPKTTIA